MNSLTRQNPQWGQTVGTARPHGAVKHLGSKMVVAIVAAVAVMLSISDKADARRVATSAANFGVVISPDSKTVNAGDTVSYPFMIQVSRGVLQPTFDVNVPGWIDAEIDSTGPNRYVLNLTVPPNAASSNGVFTLSARANRLTRRAYFRMVIVAKPTTTVPRPTVPPPTAPPTTLPPATLPPTTLAPTLPPTTQATTTTLAPVGFSIGVDNLSASLKTGDTALFNVRVDRISTFSGPIQFSLKDLPAGVQTSFSANPSNAGTVLSVTPSSATPSGKYQFQLVASAGNMQRAVNLTIDVKAVGDFSMLPSPVSVTRNTPGTATYRLDIGFASQSTPNIDFTIEGLPAGATYVFDRPGKGTPVVLSVTTSSSTPSGTYNLTVTARSGSFSRQATVQLIVSNEYKITSTVDASTFALARGATRTINVTIKPSGGFLGAVATVVNGLPPGVTATVGTTAAVVNQPFTIPITFVASPTAPVTPAAVTVSLVSTGPGVSSTSTVTMNVI